MAVVVAVVMAVDGFSAITRHFSHSSSELSAQLSAFFGALDGQQLSAIEGSCTIDSCCCVEKHMASSSTEQSVAILAQAIWAQVFESTDLTA